MDIPEAPEGISSLIKHCWDQNVASRWTMNAVNFAFIRSLYLSIITYISKIYKN